MNNRKAIALAGLGAVCLGAGLLTFRTLRGPEHRFGARKFAWMTREARELKRFDQPSDGVVSG